jgi:hypothetical protein
MEYAFNFVLKVDFWVKISVLQLHLDVALELIKLREHRYHRDSKKSPGVSPQFIQLYSF